MATRRPLVLVGGRLQEIADTDNIAGVFAYRNRVHNGAMLVDQRYEGAAFNLSVANSPYYAGDMMLTNIAAATGGSAAAQRHFYEEKFYFSLTALTALTDLSSGKYLRGLEHRIEGRDCVGLNGQYVTISFEYVVNWSGLLSVALKTLGKSYVTDVAVTAGVGRASVTIFIPAGTITEFGNGISLRIAIGFENEGIYNTAATDTWHTAADYYTSTTSTRWSKTAGNNLKITELQLELGRTATPFERRSYSTELMACRRRSRKWGQGALGLWTGSGSVRLRDVFDTMMRIPPAGTIIVASPSFELWGVSFHTGTISVASEISSVEAYEINLTGLSGPAVTTPRQTAYSNGHFMYLSADL